MTTKQREVKRRKASARAGQELHRLQIAQAAFRHHCGDPLAKSRTAPAGEGEGEGKGGANAATSGGKALKP